MKKLYLALGIIFGILTFIGVGCVLMKHGQVKAGYAVAPMVFAIAFLAMYKSKKEN